MIRTYVKEAAQQVKLKPRSFRLWAQRMGLQIYTEPSTKKHYLLTAELEQALLPPHLRAQHISRTQLYQSHLNIYSELRSAQDSRSSISNYKPNGYEAEFLLKLEAMTKNRNHESSQ